MQITNLQARDPDKPSYSLDARERQGYTATTIPNYNGENQSSPNVTRTPGGTDIGFRITVTILYMTIASLQTPLSVTGQPMDQSRLVQCRTNDLEVEDSEVVVVLVEWSATYIGIHSQLRFTSASTDMVET